MKCRITKEKCKVFLDLGQMPLANGFLEKKNLKKEYFFSLKVAFCNSLRLVQLVQNPDPKKMFNKHYPFYTSSSVMMSDHFKKYADWVKNKIMRNKKGSILEIGSNDGTFLKNFNNYYSIGYEPSKSVHDVARKSGVNSVNKFFNSKNISHLKKKNIKFNIIVGSNVICHIPNQIELIKSMDSVLEKNGTIVFEEPYLGSMYEKTSYDQIYDEHIYMFSATSIKKIYNKFGFELVDAIPQNTHGGSLRYIIKRKGIFKETKRLKKILVKERYNNIDNFKGCLNFKNKVHFSRNKIINTLNKIKSSGERICGYGATSKSTTILNFCKIGNNLIDCIFDTTKDKIGKVSPGMHIPIVNYKFFRKSGYKNVFLLAWNHKKEILKKESKLQKINWITHLV